MADESRVGEVRTILHVADAETGGGAERVFRESIRASQDLDFLVRTFVSDSRRTPTSFLFSRRHLRGLRQAIVDSRPDVVHFQNYYHYLSPSVLMAVRQARRRGWRGAVVFTAHDYHLVWPNSGLQRFRGRRTINVPPTEIPGLRPWWKFDRRSWWHSCLKLLQHVSAYTWLGLDSEIDLVLSPSELLARAIRERTGLTVEVVRNPVDVAFGHESRPGRKHADPVLLYAGRLAPEKGLKEAMAGLESLVSTQRLPERLRFWVCGSGPEAAELIEYARSLRVLRVDFLGSLSSDALASTMREAWAFILPSTWIEVSPLSIIEAAHSGLPIIVPRSGGAHETALLTARAHAYDLEDLGTLAAATAAALAEGRPNQLLDPAAFSARRYGSELHASYLRALRAVTEEPRPARKRR